MKMEETVFKTKKIDKTFLSLYLGLFVFLFGTAFYTCFQEKDARVFLAMGIICSIILLFTLAGNFWLKIIVRDQYLIVHLFFDIFKTDIRNIKTIRKGETMWSGFHKYGTTTKGLIVFSKFKNDLYISPENEELFYRKILEINPDVVIEKV